MAKQQISLYKPKIIGQHREVSDEREQGLNKQETWINTGSRGKQNTRFLQEAQRKTCANYTRGKHRGRENATKVKSNRPDTTHCKTSSQLIQYPSQCLPLFPARILNRSVTSPRVTIIERRIRMMIIHVIPIWTR